PEYHGFSGGIPKIVERFVKRLADIEKKPIYAVSTFATSAGSLMKNVSDLIANSGGRLSGGFLSRMPHSSAWAPSMASKSDVEMAVLFEDCKKKMANVADYIRSGKKGTQESIGFPPIVIKAFRLLLGKYESKKHIEGENHFWTNKDCNGCGICEKLCPVKNIKMNDRKPLWMGKCQECFGCLQWCPEEAIELQNAPITNRYRNPQISITEMANWNALVKE